MKTNETQNTMENLEMKQEVKSPTHGYYSFVLEKPFKTEEELIKAEQEHEEKELAKQQAAQARKAEASKVESAFRALNAAKRIYKQSTTEAFKAYSQAIEEARHMYNKAIEDATTALGAAEENYKASLDEFTKKHPEGYHITLRDGDYETTISKSTNDSARIKSMFDKSLFDFNDLFKTIDQWFK